MILLRNFTDKTQVFHDQIEVKQKELQPWNTKINSKQAEIDLATNERDMLAKKAADVKEALDNAQKQLEELQSAYEGKVRIYTFRSFHHPADASDRTGPRAG